MYIYIYIYVYMYIYIYVGKCEYILQIHWKALASKREKNIKKEKQHSNTADNNALFEYVIYKYLCNA